MKKIVLTGGGTAGHVTPNIALVPALRNDGYEVYYIGSYTGIEKELVEKEGIPYYGISSGKLRRYFDVKNFSDPFRVAKGYFEAKKVLKKLSPDIIFSKGGYVSVPVVLAAHALGIPAVIHESDMTPGLANRIAGKGATAFCCNFPETMKYLPSDKAHLTGSPIRQMLFDGSREKGLSFAGLSGEKPVLLIICGSLGSVSVNTMVREILPDLIRTFDIIHLTGKGNLDEALVGKYDGYRQFEYINEELPDLFAAADMVISRAGANPGSIRPPGRRHQGLRGPGSLHFGYEGLRRRKRGHREDRVSAGQVPEAVKTRLAVKMRPAVKLVIRERYGKIF